MSDREERAMSATDNLSSPPEGAQRGWPLLLKKLLIWALFLVLLYLARDFFFTAFMTFLFCYMTLSVVGWGMKRLSPNQDRQWLRRLLTVGVFLLAPLVLFGVGMLIGPRLLEQGHRLGGWMSQTTPEAEAARLLENFIGASEFNREYGDPESPAYQKALAE